MKDRMTILREELERQQNSPRYQRKQMRKQRRRADLLAWQLRRVELFGKGWGLI